MVDALSCTVRNHTSNSFNTSKISCGVAAWQVSSCSRLPTLLEDVNQIVAERDVPCLYHYCRFGIELGDVHSDAPILAHTLIEPLQKGGVPAAPSGTATLLRLSPSYSFYPRTLLAVTYSRPGNVFTAPWLMRDY